MHNENILMNCSLELAEDVSIFCRDAGGLQDSHPEGKNITNPQVLKSCVKRAVQTGLQRILQLISTSCEERKIKDQTQVKIAFQGAIASIGGYCQYIQLFYGPMNYGWMRTGKDLGH